jgi:hypothetical protein
MRARTLVERAFHARKSEPLLSPGVVVGVTATHNLYLASVSSSHSIPAGPAVPTARTELPNRAQRGGAHASGMRVPTRRSGLRRIDRWPP